MLKPDHVFNNGDNVAVEPRTLSKFYPYHKWPEPQIIKIENGHVNLVNNTKSPIILHKNDQLCHIRSSSTVIPSAPSTPVPKLGQNMSATPLHSELVAIDPDKQLSEQCRMDFKNLHRLYDHVFNPKISQYNDFSGKVRARINITMNKPPTRKLQVPNYGHKDLQLLQDKFDELERLNVFVRPEVAGIQVEHVSPSFLVRKRAGGYRLVTSFVALSPYCKVLPTTMPTVESILRTIASWKYIIVTDLSDAFYQIPLDRQSMKWCGTPTPFRGLRCYAVAAQGMPGASEALEECMSAVFGDQVKERTLGKIADDMCVGGRDEYDLFKNWAVILEKLSNNGLHIKAPKTIIAPLQAQLLGWDWQNGMLSASSHKISPLCNAEPPETVTKLRSFIGAYKFFNRVIPQCAKHISVLESSISGKQKSDKVTWDDNLITLYKSAQAALKAASSIHLPRASDQLVIVHDGSMSGIGSVLYLNRDNVLVVGSFFSAKLKEHQNRWYPCEIEALSISCSIHHFSPYIRESDNTTQVLTDSRPCVQSWEKMKRGEFSTSTRVATFLSTLAEFDVEVQHISGVQNLPSDFQSRNPPECNSPSCQICSFVEEAQETVIRSITVDEILSGKVSVPYNNRGVWKKLQSECQDLSRVHTHLKHGTRPTSKRTKLTTVKRYLQNVKIGKDGVLVVIRSEPFFPPTELIVVPEHLIHGLLTSLHLTLNHATVLQLVKVFKRQFHALRLQQYADIVVDHCHTCRSLKVLPKEYHPQTTTDLPTTPGKTFSADIIRRFKQKIFVLRESFSSFTITSLQRDEEHGTLRTALIQSISQIRPNPRSRADVRVDNAPGFKALKNDVNLNKLNIFLDMGRVHNPNKNPVVDKGIQELISEILKYNTEAGPITADTLAVVTNQLNSRIRGRGLTAWEILHQRDHETGNQLDIDDERLMQLQESTRLSNQHSSAKHKAKGGPIAQSADVVPGSLVYIKHDRNKNRGRERYIVVDVDGSNCTLRKLLKSQIRSQDYTLKLTEVMLVTPNTVCREDYSKGLDSSDEDEAAANSSSTVDMDLREVANTSLAVNTSSSGIMNNVNDPVSHVDSGEIHNPFGDHVEALDPDIPGSELMADNSAVTNQDEVFGVPPIADSSGVEQRRSTRQKKPPAWMEDYE